MSNLQTWNPWIGPRAEKLAGQLTVQSAVIDGYGLAIYLDVDRCYTNHQAIRIWVQRLLDEDYQVELDYLNQVMLSLLPSEWFS